MGVGWHVEKVESGLAGWGVSRQSFGYSPKSGNIRKKVHNEVDFA